MCFLLNWAKCVSGLSLGEGPAEEEDGKKPIHLNRGAWSSPDLAPRDPSPHPVIVQLSGSHPGLHPELSFGLLGTHFWRHDD